MDPLTIATFVDLIAKVGLPLALQIRQWYVEGRQNTAVTDADIALVVSLGKYTSGDALTAAGIEIANGVVKPLPTPDVSKP